MAVAEPEPEPVAAAQPPQDVVQQPVWLSVAPDPDATPAAPPAQAPANGGLPAAASGAPQSPSQPEWPAQPQWPSARSSTPRPNTILGRPVVPTGGIDALWAASSRDVVAPMATAPTPLGQQTARGGAAVHQLRALAVIDGPLLPALRNRPDPALRPTPSGGGRLALTRGGAQLGDPDPGSAVQQRLERERQPGEGHERGSE